MFVISSKHLSSHLFIEEILDFYLFFSSLIYLFSGEPFTYFIKKKVIENEILN